MRGADDGKGKGRSGYGAIGSTIYGGRAPTIVVAVIVGILGAFLSFKGYVRRV